MLVGFRNRGSIAIMLTQIYEVSTPEEARSISQIGVDHIGVLVGISEFPRELPVEAAAKLAAGIVTPSKFSARPCQGNRIARKRGRG
jgi:hypothetical protein